ncbi:hypothetical protein GCM10010289_69260 [Streptomyces violascens]|nr:hypothetical protein GCM10010289_69260 [Streptomyces violascens]
MQPSTLIPYEQRLHLALPPARDVPSRQAAGPGAQVPLTLKSLEARRRTINRAALSQAGSASVVAYALTVADQTPNADLAAARGYATIKHLDVVATIVDTLDSVDARADEPFLRRGYARVLRMMADPDSPVRGEWPSAAPLSPSRRASTRTS